MENTASSWQALQQWWKTPLGQSFLTTESAIVKKLIPTLFGYHLLLLGDEAFMPAVTESPIGHKVWIHPPMLEMEKNEHLLMTRFDKLPIIADGVDLIYLAHCLEFIKNPHEVLRETFRILIPEGHVVVSIFNPWSLWGLWRFFLRFMKRIPWNGHFISTVRLKDWLALLGFDVVDVHPYFFRPPISHSGVLKRLEWLEKIGQWCWPFFAGGYVVLARKRIITLTPVRPLVKIKEKILVPDMVEPARSE